MPEVFASRFGATLITGLVLASAFWKLDLSLRASEERVRCMAFVTAGIFFICSDGMAIVPQQEEHSAKVNKLQCIQKIFLLSL